MSELTIAREPYDKFRRKLLGTVSTFTLLAMVMTSAEAGDADHPTVWIELGGQLERVDGNPLPFVPIFNETAIEHGLPPPTSVENGGRYGVGGEGSITFAPEGTDWQFSAAIRYGRSNSTKRHHQQTPAPKFPNPLCPQPCSGQPYFTMVRSQITADNSATSNRNTAIVDFQAGKDVGLGLLGRGNSKLNLGVRFAQFTTSSKLEAFGIPYPHDAKKYVSYFHTYFPSEHSVAYHATASSRRSFSGFGPSLSWHETANLIRERDGSPSLLFDWGINGGVLFGRQKASVHYKTQSLVFSPKYGYANNFIRTFYHGPFTQSRSHSVVVPNLGGQASLSLKFPNAKVSLGYRADFFFGAMDGGIETRKNRDLSFHGPFATISFGFGGQ